MATYFLNLSSDEKETGQFTDDFTCSFDPPIRISNNFALGLHSGTLWYSYYNISSDYNNQIFRYYNGSVWKNITITAGLYSIDDINTFVHNAMLANGDYTNVGGVNVFDIVITPDYNTFKLLITLTNSYQVDLSVGNLYQIFGFSSIVISSTQEGPNNVDISNGIDKLLIHVDCVTGSYVNGSASDVIYGFSPNVKPSSLIELNPTKIVYLPLNKTGFLQKMRIRITDQSNRRVNLNGEQVTMSLYLKQI